MISPVFSCHLRALSNKRLAEMNAIEMSSRLPLKISENAISPFP
jgi:hypothetical protein